LFALFDPPLIRLSTTHGQTTATCQAAGDAETLTPPAAFTATGNFDFSYGALRRRTQMTRPHGRKSVYAYDNPSWLQSVLHQAARLPWMARPETQDSSEPSSIRVETRHPAKPASRPPAG